MVLKKLLRITAIPYLFIPALVAFCCISADDLLQTPIDDRDSVNAIVALPHVESVPIALVHRSFDAAMLPVWDIVYTSALTISPRHVDSITSIRGPPALV